MQSRNTAELRNGFSSLLRVFDVAAACTGILFSPHIKIGCGRFLFRNAVPQPLCCSFLFCKFFLFPVKQNHHRHQCSEKIGNRLGGNDPGEAGKF